MATRVLGVLESKYQMLDVILQSNWCRTL